MNKKGVKSIVISDDTSGNEIRAYLLEAMKELQQIREMVNNLKGSAIVMEFYSEKLQDAHKNILNVNSILGDIIGFTVADDIWEKQKVTL